LDAPSKLPVIALLKRSARLLNISLGRILTSFWSAGVAAFSALALYQSALTFEAGDRGGALFLAIFGCLLVVLAAVLARADYTFTDAFRAESELSAGWRLLTARSKRR
jgi:hypothetical protein